MLSTGETMTDLGVLTAARKEAEQYLCGPTSCEWCAERQIGFENGALWAAGRLPTRDEIAEVMIAVSPDAAHVTNDEREWYLRDADAVLALITRHLEA